jgi:hypothetical protein
MTYELVDSFSAGLDTRRSPLASPGGTLTVLKNAMITPGGEIQKRRAFVKVADLPADSFGLASTESKLVIFGKNASPIPPPVVGVTIVTLKVPNTAADIGQFDYDVFDGKIYLAASVPSGATDILKNPHYYDNVGGIPTPGTPMVQTEGSGKGYYVRTYQSKIYSVTGKYLYFSAVNDPKLWDSGTGHGYINVSLQDADSEMLTSLEVYYDKLAVFSDEATQLWAVDPDPLQNAYVQLLRGSGTLAPRSPLQYGSGDVLFLDKSGIRSIKARDSSNSAAVSDIGSPVDPTVRLMRATLSDPYMSKAVALLEPSVGRFWMCFPNEVLVLSYFPGPKITAWSVQTLGFTMQHAVTCAGKIYFRDTNNGLWVYGGTDGLAYDNCGVEVRMPYLSGKKPGHNKIFEAIDMTIKGTWEVRAAYDVNAPEAEETIGTFTQSTWSHGRSEMTGYASHVSLRFYNNDALPAELSNVAIHYQVVDDEA